MKTIKPLFIILGLLLVIIFSLSSCSVKKRVHMPGYHVEWHNKNNNNNSNKNKEVKNNNTIQSEKTIAQNNISEKVPTNENINYENIIVSDISDHIILPEKKKLDLPIAHKESFEKEKKEEIKTSKTKSNYKNDPPTNSERELYGLAIPSFIFGIIGLSMPLFIFFNFFAIFLSIFSILALIFGIISIVKIKRNRDKYNGMGFAIAAVAMGGLGIAMALYFSFVYLLIFVIFSGL